MKQSRAAWRWLFAVAAFVVVVTVSRCGQTGESSTLPTKVSTDIF